MLLRLLPMYATLVGICVGDVVVMYLVQYTSCGHKHLEYGNDPIVRGTKIELVIQKECQSWSSKPRKNNKNCNSHEILYTCAIFNCSCCVVSQLALLAIQVIIYTLQLCFTFSFSKDFLCKPCNLLV